MRSDAVKTADSPTAVIQVKQPRNRHQIANALIKSRLKQQQQAPQISLQKSMLKPSRRPRFHPTLAADELFPSFLGDTGIEDSLMLEDGQVMNTFYNAPVGRENWSIKHIEPRAHTQAIKNVISLVNQRRASMQERLPKILPTVKAAPPRFVSKVMKNHYRTQDKVSESSRRAGRVVDTSADTIQRAR